MHPRTLQSFSIAVGVELSKEANVAPGAGVTGFVKRHASTLGHGAEVAGLGILAKPSWDEYRGKKVDEKKKAKYELAGLGVLAAPSAINLAHHAWSKFRG